MLNNLHSDPVKKIHESPFCQKPFEHSTHVRISHKELIHKMDEEEKQYADLQHF
jgi:hypothetical protein